MAAKTEGFSKWVGPRDNQERRRRLKIGGNRGQFDYEAERRDLDRLKIENRQESMKLLTAAHLGLVKQGSVFESALDYKKRHATSMGVVYIKLSRDETRLEYKEMTKDAFEGFQGTPLSCSDSIPLQDVIGCEEGFDVGRGSKIGHNLAEGWLGFTILFSPSANVKGTSNDPTSKMWRLLASSRSVYIAWVSGLLALCTPKKEFPPCANSQLDTIQELNALVSLYGKPPIPPMPASEEP